MSHLFFKIFFRISISGSSKGVGFVRFDQRMEAEIAIEKLNGSIPEGSLYLFIVYFHLFVVYIHPFMVYIHSFDVFLHSFVVYIH